MNNELRHGREGEEWSKLGRGARGRRPDWGFGKAEGEVYIAQHSERSVRLVQSASSSGIHIGIQTTIIALFWYEKARFIQMPNQFSYA